MLSEAQQPCVEFSNKAEIPLGSNQVCPVPAEENVNGNHGDGFKANLQSLSKTALRIEYRAEESCHKNMLRREKTKGAIIHPTFRTFLNFLSIMGPMPHKGMTVDRIENNDPEYAPHKVRWADKVTQNSNKSDSHVFVCANTAKTFSTSQLAKLHGVTLSAIRKRRSNGWTDDEIIAGHRLQSCPASAKPKGPNPASSVHQFQGNFLAFSASPLWDYPQLDFPAGLYTAKQRHRICNPTMDDYRFSEDARYHQLQRQYGDGECIPVTKGEFIRNMLDDGDGYLLGGLKDDGDEWRFVRSIKDNPHLYFLNLPEHLREIVRDHDPEWVAGMEHRFHKLYAQSANAADGALAEMASLGSQL